MGMFSVTASSQTSNLYPAANSDAQDALATSKLVHLCLIHRHGERTPISGQDLNGVFATRRPWRLSLPSDIDGSLPFTLRAKRRHPPSKTAHGQLKEKEEEEEENRPLSKQEEKLLQTLHGAPPPCGQSDRRGTLEQLTLPSKTTGGNSDNNDDDNDENKNGGSVDVVGGGTQHQSSSDHAFADDMAEDVRGTLTEKGYKNMVALGQRFRKRYANFLPPTFEPSRCYLRSTDVSRTIQSLGAVLEGLFTWDADEKAVVEIETRPLNKETMVLSPTICPTYHETTQDYVIKTLRPLLRHEDVQRLLQRFLSARNASISPDRQDDEEIELVSDIIDLTLARMGHGEDVHDIIDQSAFDRLEAIHRLRRFGMLHDSKHCTKLAIGPFLQELVDVFKQPTASDHLLSIFSAHDGTIGRLLVALGYREARWPAFCSNVMFELLEDAPGTPLLVQIRYNERLLALPFAKDTSATLAPLQDLIAYIEDILATS